MKFATVAALIGTLLFPGLVVGQANTASLLNLTTNTVISNFVVGIDPQGVAWFGNNVAFVVNDADNTLVRLDMTTSPPTINQTFTFVIDSNFGPHAVAINPAGTRALVAGDGASLYILNISTTPFTIVDTIPVVADAGGVAYYSGGTRAIVANESNRRVKDQSPSSTPLTPPSARRFPTRGAEERPAIHSRSTRLERRPSSCMRTPFSALTRSHLGTLPSVPPQPEWKPARTQVRGR